MDYQTIRGERCMEIITQAEKDLFIDSFPEELRETIKRDFLFIGKENGFLFFKPSDDRNFLEQNK